MEKNREPKKRNFQIYGQSCHDNSMKKGQMLGKLDSYMEGIKLDFYLMPYTKVNSKRIKDLIRLKTTKLPEENRGKLDTGFESEFPVYNTKAQTTEAKIDKWDYQTEKLL